MVRLIVRLWSGQMKGLGANPGAGRVELQVENCRFDGFLLFTGQPHEAVVEGVGAAEVHSVTEDRVQATYQVRSNFVMHE